MIGYLQGYMILLANENHCKKSGRDIKFYFDWLLTREFHVTENLFKTKSVGPQVHNN